jgi:uncharacterized protein YqeY
MPLREAFTEALKTSMRAGDAPRTSTLRLILAKVKDADIAARPKEGGGSMAGISDEDIAGVLRGMVKQRRESVALYTQGNRPELADKETAEIAVIESFLPQRMDDDTLAAAVEAAIAEAGATAMKDMGRVMAALKSRHGSALDMGRANAAVKARLTAG